MKAIKSPKVYDDVLNNAVVVSGIPRSGTTLLGKLVSSLKGIEYSFEPPILGPIDFALQKGIGDKDLLMLILQTHLSQDVILNHLQGRNLNMRPGDDSSVFEYKDYSEVLSRWCTACGVKDAVRLMYENNSRLLFKAIHRFSLMPILSSRFPGLRVIEIRRDLHRVAMSIYNKGWFNKDNIIDEHNVAGYLFEGDGVPYFISDELSQNWMHLSDESRAARVTIDLAKRSLAAEQAMDSSRFYIVRYEKLLLDPRSELQKLADYCSLDVTAISNLRLAEVVERLPHFSCDEFLARQDQETTHHLEKVNNEWSYPSK